MLPTFSGSSRHAGFVLASFKASPAWPVASNSLPIDMQDTCEARFIPRLSQLVCPCNGCGLCSFK